MKLFQCYALNGKPSAADCAWIVCENLVKRGRLLCSR
jgi:hypothetical protein